jgi:protein-tyrosine-phosphatase
MAEALFDRYATGKARAFSAGTQPAQSVNPTVAEAMSEIGIDIASKTPKALTIDMLECVNRVITMGCSVEDTCPATLIPSEDWGLDDPEGRSPEEVRRIRDEIAAKVKVLIVELESF